MGKKSKNPSKQDKKKDAKMANKSLQELQASIDSMSIKDALTAVQMAKNKINHMKEEQEKAAREVKQARVEVEKSKIDKNKNDFYADESFWEKRYQEDKRGQKSTDSEIYEWYLNFDEIKSLLVPDIVNARKEVANATGDVLVAGCGNSSMCEDLFNAGVINICGMDYSQSVIDTMNNRLNSPSLTPLKQGGVRYLRADGTKMPSAMKSTCSAVVDKGTLDAITSGGVAEGGENLGTRNALAYTKEMWRILQPNGVFIIISTMPPHLFHLIGSSIIPALANESKQEKRTDVTHGDGYRINSFVTKEGGSVYYYSLFKSSVSSNQSSSSKKSQMPTNYETLMAEAQAAMKELEEAQAEVKLRTDRASLLSKDLRDTETKAERLSKVLDSDLSSNVVKSVIEEAKSSSHDPALSGSDLDLLKENVNGLEKIYTDSKKTSKSADNSSFESCVDSSIPLSLPKFPTLSDDIPKVVLKVLPSSSELMSEGHVEVEFSLSGGKWDEDDFISLHHPTQLREDVYSEFDHFEYTEEPQKVCNSELGQNILVGKCKINLPSYGGPFYLVYRRTYTTISDKTIDDIKPGEELRENDAVVTRVNKALASSDVFEVSFKVQSQWRATGANIKCRNLKSCRHFMKILEDPALHISTNFDNLMYMIEDLQSINVLSVTIKTNPSSEKLKMNDNDVEFSRISAWMSCSSLAHITGRFISIEADCHEKLSYIHVRLPECPPHYELKLQSSRGQIVSSGGKLDSKKENCIVIRIPYEYLTNVDLQSKKPESSNDIVAAGLECAFCHNTFVANGRIRHFAPLPSGKFDHMMHEFLCSENPLVPLSIDDMDTASESATVGNVFCSVSARDVRKNDELADQAIVLSCKTNPSMIDSLSSAMTSAVNSAGKENDQQQAMIDLSTCAVTCGRCGIYVGDGRIVDQEEESAESNVPERGHFELNDVSIIKFIRSRVLWQSENMTFESDSLREVLLPVEKVWANLLIAASSLYGTSNFELYVPDSLGMKLRIRLLSRPRDGSTVKGVILSGYSVYTPPIERPIGKCGVNNVNDSVTLRNAVKISYCFLLNDMRKERKGNFRVIAVDFNDFVEVMSVLKSREIWSSISFQSNERIGYLLM